MTEEMEKNLNLITRYVEGGVSEGLMNIVDVLIDEGDIEQEWFDLHEVEFLNLIDERFFGCEVCDWTVPVEVMSEYENERVCTDCAGENEHD